MLKSALIACSLLVLSWASVSLAASGPVGHARSLHEHGLSQKAKEVLIAFMHAARPPKPAQQAKALQLLGEISFAGGHHQVALRDWKTLVAAHPNSPEAKQISARLVQLSEVLDESMEATVSSAVARAYLKNGDFWSKGKNRFVIDSSWLPQVEMAVAWYDRVIKEFAGKDAAELAYRNKLFALLGSKETGRYGSAYGVEDDFVRYMPLVLATFNEFTAAFPKSSFLQGFRYLIAQAYWKKKDWPNTEAWLNHIVKVDQGRNSFYALLARARLRKVEY